MRQDGDRPEPALLHVHGQASWQDDVWILGNRKGVLALRAAVEAALAGGEGMADVMAADGEGYCVVAMVEDAPWESPGWESVALPYTAAEARDTREEAIWPWHRPPKKESEHA